MDQTSHFYESNAKAFFESTFEVDMGPLRSRFVRGLKADALILDAGCGSGRDSKAFSDMGFRVAAFDASDALAQLATEHCGFQVGVRRFADVHEISTYDAIWCCASLLHVPVAEIPGTLVKLWAALRPGGRIYVSFKRGRGERESGGRWFTDADEDAIRSWFSTIAGLMRLDVWETQDQRPDRTESWTNAIAWRAETSDNRLVTGGDDHFLPHLSEAFSRSNQVDLAVAFVKSTGLRLLLPDLRRLLLPESSSLVADQKSNRLRILTSDYLDITDPEALRLLLLLQEQGAEVRIYTTADSSFHLKAYIFARLEQDKLVAGTAFIGSSNISRQALQEGLEWN
jgi:HKD family nuclease